MELTDYAFDTRIRRRHIPLLSNQRRLRHLTAIHARNVVSPEISETEYFGLFYTIHLNRDDPAIYTSEVCENNLNPMWQQLQMAKFNNLRNNSSKSLVVRVWLTKRNDSCATCLIEWDVNLHGLSFLGEQVPKDGRKFLPNTLLFAMPEGIYGAANTIVQGPKGDNSGHNLYEVLYSDPTVMRNSCSVNSLKRMMMTERAIKQTQASVSRVRRAIEQRLQQRLQLHERLAEQEKVQLRIGLLKEVIEERSRQLEKEQVACRAKAQELADKEKHLAAMAAELVEKRNTLVERRRHYFEVRENLLKTSSRLLFRQKELITELAFIYPVVSFPEEKGYTICLVHLPNSEDFSDRDDQMISVALGYVAHTLLMMSHFLDMPLRYPLIHCGSMSSVRDNLIEHFTDKEREFPLYMKGKDRMTFNYGVYLLNRNIAQLRCYCNIVTKDLRTTLHNLHGLYEFYSIKQNSQPSSAPVPVPASPLAVPIKGNNTIGSAREQRSSDHVLSPPTAKREDMEHIFKCGEEPSGGAEASAAVAPQKLSSSLDKGLDSFQSTVTTEPEDKRSTALPVKFPTLKSSYRLSEPNLREFEARTMFKERRAVTEHLLPVPPVVYDATEESGSLNSGDGIVEVAVDTLFDADLTARTEQLASAVRSFRTYSSVSSSNGPSPKP
ncbi:UV radiation resistance-associated protein isoform X2 [Rhipicephalus sanguineus]|uniref:UV radiation resistance-associated protein isoform X2 n=1 Tax=Rhipicephalus sanguineus TaxID=34632 RepID=UPI0018947C9A|nr:UV radiation resistance-associated protein isoform X2 [Rhipicephalus sanguineus]